VKFVWNGLCSIAALVLTGLNQNQFFKQFNDAEKQFVNEFKET